MDIEEFYDEDERRRHSKEVEFGQDWHDEAGVRCELSWVEDTGELYAMREPASTLVVVDPFGDWRMKPAPVEAVTVHVLGVLSTREQIEEVLDGWRDQMPKTNSIAWAIQRVRTALSGPMHAPTEGEARHPRTGEELPGG